MDQNYYLSTDLNMFLSAGDPFTPTALQLIPMFIHPLGSADLLPTTSELVTPISSLVKICDVVTIP